MYNLSWDPENCIHSLPGQVLDWLLQTSWHKKGCECQMTKKTESNKLIQSDTVLPATTARRTKGLSPISLPIKPNSINWTEQSLLLHCEELAHPVQWSYPTTIMPSTFNLFQNDNHSYSDTSLYPNNNKIRFPMSFSNFQFHSTFRSEHHHHHCTYT
jgi:hypothetical protein